MKRIILAFLAAVSLGCDNKQPPDKLPIIYHVKLITESKTTTSYEIKNDSIVYHACQPIEILKNKKKYKGLFCPAGPAYIENK